MNVLQKGIRRVHVPFYAAKLLWETARVWGFPRWLRFWMSRKDELRIAVGDMTFSVRGSSIKTKMTDTFAIMESLHHNLYSRRFHSDEFRIDPGDTVIDIGGYIGSFSVPASRLAGGGRVFSFEPSPANFRQLERNLRLNGAANVTAFNLGVASTDRKITLFLDHMNPASNSIYLKGADQVEGDAVSLKTFFARENIDRCQFLKIDCEGAEYEILMTLDRAMLDRIGRIACEYHEPVYYGVEDPAHTPDALVKFLEKEDFTVYRKPVNPYLGMLYAVNRRFGAREASSKHQAGAC